MSAVRKNVLSIRPDTRNGTPAGSHTRAQLLEMRADGLLVVRDSVQREFACEWLETGADLALKLGDTLLVAFVDGAAMPLAVGRIGRYRAPQTEKNLRIEATESLTLKCGESSVDLRADGKLMIRGDDVLVRARGTQRIKAGTVNIN